ncbi:hypothetical protein DM02DRAFT_630241 [Periconia macrospinosa]|uniref:Uncharacterized protein n=1 Tax=Periconia macrospinosa TaxID=97972 RepID=A0A2V1DJU6_9PLEO|nr:hypothetical protein DM02DRAFT_630241 [Periconia macrospinosa]
MPKVSRTKKAYKQAESQEKTSKILKFAFERKIHECTIYRHHSADDIRTAIRDSLSLTIFDNFAITDPNGRPLELHFKGLKDNMNIQVHRINTSIQNPDNLSRPTTKTEERLAKIVENWQLDHALDILDGDIAPRSLNLKGEHVTSFDDDTRQLQPSEWAAKFVEAMFWLSEASVGQHAEAVRELEQARRERVDAQQGLGSIQVTTQDCKAAREKMLRSLTNIAEDAMDVVDTETFVGGIGDALEGVENEIETDKFVGGIKEALDDA